MSFQLVELARRLENLIRIGTVADVDYPAARVRVASGDMVTTWIPWLTQRASHDVDWWAPEVGERVMLLCPSGDPANAVALPAAYHTERPGPADTADKRVVVFRDGSRFEYDRAQSRWQVTLVGDAVLDIAGDLTATVGGKAAITAGDEVTVDAPMIHHNGGTGVVTGECICHFTGNPHGDLSSTVTAGK